MRYERLTFRLPFDLVQRARFLVKHRRTHYSFIGFVTKGLAREVTKAERKERIHWLKPIKIRIRLPGGRRKKVSHGRLRPK